VLHSIQHESLLCYVFSLYTVRPQTGERGGTGGGKASIWLSAWFFDAWRILFPAEFVDALCRSVDSRSVVQRRLCWRHRRGFCPGNVVNQAGYLAPSKTSPLSFWSNPLRRRLRPT